jgi:hypothetical protein
MALVVKGTDIKVQQELLRHSTIQSTLNTYTQAISEQKRSANTVVVGILFNENASTDQPPLMGAKRHSARGVWDACNHIQATVFVEVRFGCGGWIFRFKELFQ